MKKTLVVLGAMILVQAGRADPPKLTNCFPAGAQRGETATVTVGATFKSWPVNVWCNNPDIKFAASKKRGQISAAIAKDAVPTLCWFRLYNNDGASEIRPFLIGAVPEVLEKEPNNDPSKPQPLSSSIVTVNGRIQRSGDVDVFALELKKGETLVASMEANRNLKSPMDAILQILSEDGFVVAQNDDYHGMDPQIVFPVLKDGRYLVRTFAFPATPNSSIGFAGSADYIYRLTLTTGPFADHAFPLAVQRGKQSRVDLVGWNISPTLKSVAIQTDGKADAALAFIPQCANAAAIGLEPHETLIETKADKGPQEVPFPSTVTGRITKPGELDEFQFTVQKGQRFAIDIDAAAIGAPLDPVLRLIDGAGKDVKTVQSRTIGADPTITLTAPKDMTYRIVVCDLHNRGGMRFVYRLRVAAPAPSFALKVAKDRFEVAVGKTLEIPITITRINGHREAIEIVAEKLPSGVHAKPVVADAKTKTVKLRLAGNGKNVVGPFQIIGRSKTIERRAKATIAELGINTPHLWITSKAK